MESYRRRRQPVAAPAPLTRCTSSTAALLCVKQWGRKSRDNASTHILPTATSFTVVRQSAVFWTGPENRAATARCSFFPIRAVADVPASRRRRWGHHHGQKLNRERPVRLRFTIASRSRPRQYPPAPFKKCGGATSACIRTGATVRTPHTRTGRRSLGSPDGFAQATQLTSVFPIRLWLAVLVPIGRPPETRALHAIS